MGMEIVVATKNKGKLREIEELLSPLRVKVFSMWDFPGFPGVVEDGETFLDNALKKAREVCRYTHRISLADDSGLEVEALAGRPGTRSARYAGENATDKANNRKLLEEMKNVPKARRKAHFRCVIALVTPEGEEHWVEGICDGEVAYEEKGNEGFGYDPIFIVDGYSETFAELGQKVKNKVSHRARALVRLKERLRKVMQTATV